MTPEKARLTGGEAGKKRGTSKRGEATVDMSYNVIGFISICIHTISVVQ